MYKVGQQECKNCEQAYVQQGVKKSRAAPRVVKFDWLHMYHYELWPTIGQCLKK